jgi:hypothetical protein
MQTKYSKNDVKLQAIDKTLEDGTLLASLKQNINIYEVNGLNRPIVCVL